jgi:hypothetical protein
LASLRPVFSAFGLVEVGGRLLDQRHHVALAQDAAGHAAGVEGVERVDLLARAQELDRQAGDRRAWRARARRGCRRRRGSAPGR